MVSPNEQYHAMVNLSRAMLRKDMLEKSILVCAFAYNFDSVSERNFMNLLNYVGIDFQKPAPYRILHFCYATDMISVRDEELGLVRTLSSVPVQDEYTEEKIIFARKEMERIKRRLFDG